MDKLGMPPRPSEPSATHTFDPTAAAPTGAGPASAPAPPLPAASAPAPAVLSPAPAPLVSIAVASPLRRPTPARGPAPAPFLPHMSPATSLPPNVMPSVFATVPAIEDRRRRAGSVTPTPPRFLLDPAHPQHIPPHVALVTLEEKLRSSHRQLREEIAEVSRDQKAFADSVSRRNRRVELDHHWNTSLVRGLLIMAFTCGTQESALFLSSDTLC